MEHYSELVKLRKKYGFFDRTIKQEEDEQNFNLSIVNYPATTISYLFHDELSERDKYWLMYENEVLINRGFIPLPHAVVLSLKNYIFLLEKDKTINQLIAELYKFEAYNPLTCLIPVDSLPDNIKPVVKKALLTLIDIEKSLAVFACGTYKGKGFSFCRYHRIDQNIAKVFIENNCTILYANFKNNICIYFDPMVFEEEDLLNIGRQMEKVFKTTVKVNTDYNNYSITFRKEISSIDVFNSINDSEHLRIVKPNQKQNQIKIKVNKPVASSVENDNGNASIPKNSFSNKFKK